MESQPVNKPTTAYVLTLVGSILGIIAGIILVFVIVGIWIVIANILTLYYALKLNEEPLEHSRYGTYIIVLSILSGLNVLSLIGGILAVTYAPIPHQTYPHTQPYSPYSQPQQARRYCTQCGTMVNEYDQFCPHCGKQQR
jgi:hypothetical protein